MKPKHNRFAFKFSHRPPLARTRARARSARSRDALSVRDVPAVNLGI